MQVQLIDAYIVIVICCLELRRKQQITQNKLNVANVKNLCKGGQEMVETKEKVIYVCPYCSDEYENMVDAQACADGCVEVESPEIDHQIWYACEVCSNVFEEESDAERCEKKHPSEDLARAILRKAAQNPNQKDLSCFGVKI